MISRLENAIVAPYSILGLAMRPAIVVVCFGLACFCQTKHPERTRRRAHPTTSSSSRATTSRAVPRSSATAIPADAQPPISAALGADDASYHVRRYGHGYRAENSRQNLVADFTPAGVAVKKGDASFRFKFSGYGAGRAFAAIRAASPRVRANRIEYLRGQLTEWYVNGPAGLEQGFTLQAPPKRQTAGPLQIALGYSGDLQPELDKNGAALVLKRRDGSTALRYTGLEAHDADGHALHASMELRRNSLRLLVDDHDARYPVVVDPLFQAAILTASNGTKEDGFGIAIAVSGDGNTIVVGEAAINGSSEAYVFEKQGAAWTSMTEVRRLSDPNNLIGESLAITRNGDTILSSTVAGLTEDVFVRPGTSWSGSNDKTPDATLTQTLSATNVAISKKDGSAAVVGVDHSDFGNPPWQLLVFLRPGDAWSGTVNPAATLTGSDPNLFSFRNHVAIDSGGGVIVGNAEISQGDENDSGELLVFLEPEGGWTSETETAILEPNSSITRRDDFGFDVAISDDGATILAGESSATVNSNTRQGEAFVFVEPETGWTSTTTPSATLFDASGAAEDRFGSPLAISGDSNHILVGAPFVDEGPGRVSTFDMPAGGWTGTLSAPENLTASDSSEDFGMSVSISDNGGVAAVGATQLNQIGEAFVFTPCVSLDPKGFDFGNLLVGTASPPKTFTLSNSCAAVVTNIDISLSIGKAFSQNNTCGSTLLGNASCDINVTFTPSAVASFLDSVVVSDSDTSSSPQNAVLAGTGVCGVSLAPGSFDFGNINVGNSSPPTAFTLSNQCTTDVTGVAISFSGTNSADFWQNNTCGGAIPASGSCTINVTFTPTTGGAESAKLVVAENDPSSPQQATLTGTGVALSGDFSITPTDAEPPSTPGSTTSATVSAGSSATYALSVKSLAGFNSTVALSAAFTGSNQPIGTNLSFDVNPVTPTTSGVTSTLTVSTSAPHAFMMRTATETRYAVWLVTFPLMLFGMAWLPVSVGTRRRAVKSALLLCAVCAILFASSCVPKAPATPGTATGTYQILVTGTGGGITHTANVTLVVQ